MKPSLFMAWKMEEKGEPESVKMSPECICVAALDCMLLHILWDPCVWGLCPQQVMAWGGDSQR